MTHPKLAHDPLAVNSLFRILDQASGLTFVSGFSDEQRTFILTSLGNSASWNDARNRVSGLDVHTPDYFSPVPGVYYFPQPQTPEQVGKVVVEIWRAIEQSGARLILLNGIWSADHQLRKSMVKLAETTHVIIADTFELNCAKQIMQPGLRKTMIAVSQDKTRKEHLNVRIV